MKYISTRKGCVATSVESVFRGLAPDGGLYVPEKVTSVDLTGLENLGDAERRVLSTFFSDFPEDVREDAVKRLLSRFPEGDPVPLVKKGGFNILELFHGRTGAFKDVALSMLPVFMRHSAGNRGVMVLAATSGDTGSAAMEGFADVEGTKVTVLFPETGTSLVQRLQMTTCAASNVKAIAVKGNFDDAQAAVKRIFADKAMNEYASSRSLYLSSANSINTGRLIPQIGYYVMTGSRLGGKMFDVVVPSGNFGNILAAYYAKMMGVNIRKFVCASNVNDVLARFVATGVYEPGEKFFVTNSPSMDIRKSSNVERLLWLLNGGAEGDVEKACFETNRLMEDFNSTGRYELSPEAKERLFAQFSGGYATEEETEEEMRLMRSECGYLLDPHTAVGVSVAKKLSLPESGIECVIAATATPYKFPETCRHAFSEDVLSNPPESFRDLLTRPVVQNMTVEKEFIDEKVKETM